LLGQGVDEDLEAFPEGEKEAIAGAGGLLAASQQGADDAAVEALHLQKLRHGGGQAQVLGVGAVDAAEQRLGQAIERFLAKPAADEAGQGLVAQARAAGKHEVEQHPRLARPGDHGRTYKGPDGRWGHEVQAFGDREEPLAAHDEAPAGFGPDANALIREAKLAAEIGDPGFVEKAVGAGLHEVAAAAAGLNDAAQTAGGLVQVDLGSSPGEAVGRRQAAYTSADNRYTQGKGPAIGRLEDAEARRCAATLIREGSLIPTYISLTIYLGLAGLLAVILIFISGKLSPNNPSASKLQPYECGISEATPMEARWPVRFALVAMLFLVFDVEGLFLYPWAVLMRELSWTGIGVMASFFVVLGVGYVYARGRGALEWR
jgi:NADH-quinone oxidoreductase subunit A